MSDRHTISCCCTEKDFFAQVNLLAKQGWRIVEGTYTEKPDLVERPETNSVRYRLRRTVEMERGT